jgi:hypothetical protein
VVERSRSSNGDAHPFNLICVCRDDKRKGRGHKGGGGEVRADQDTAREALRGSSGEPVVLLGPLQFAHPSLLVLFGMALLIGSFFPS